MPVTLITPLPELIKYKSSPSVAILTVLIPTGIPAIVSKINPPFTVVSVIGSVQLKFSLKTICASVSEPLSTLTPDFNNVIPAPVSPLFTVMILSCTSKFVELTIV